MSAPKPKAKSSVNKQVKAAIKTVRDFIAGKAPEAKVAELDDKELRQVVAAELLAVMSRGAEAKPHADHASSAGAEEDGRLTNADRGPAQAIDLSNPAQMWAEPEHAKPVAQQKQERARQLFLEHGYFDEAVHDLRAASSPAQRAEAARALGLVGSRRGTAHLIAAMFDDDPDVRNTAEHALTQIGEPAAADVAADAIPDNSIDSEISAMAEGIQRAQSTNADAMLDAHAKSPMRDSSGRFLPRRYEDEPATAESISEEVQITVEQIIVTDQTAGVDQMSAREEEQLLLEEHAVRETVDQLERQLLETATLRKESENEAIWRTEREVKLRADAAARRHEEEELRQRADEETARRRSQETEAMTVEQVAALQAEVEAHRLAEEEARLRIEAASLRLAAEELARQRTEMETARKEATEAARQAEAERTRQEAQMRHQSELARLRSEEEDLRIAVEEAVLRRGQVETALQQAKAEIARLTKEQAQLVAAEEARRTEAERRRREAEERNRAEQEQLLTQLEELRHVGEQIAVRRNEVEAAREKADEDARQLMEAQARMRAAEEERAQVEAERLQVEAQINQAVDTERRLLEEALRRAQEERELLEEAVRRRAESEQQRLAELEVIQTKTEIEARQRAEKEQAILSQVDSLRIADAETRKRIEEAEVRRRAAEEAYRLAAEKLQRVEAEAHARAKEEEQMLGRLEVERRSVAVEAQARADQEKRIKEEIELFRRLEEDERPRLELATLQRTEAEARVRQQKAQIEAEEQGRLRAEEKLNALGRSEERLAEEPGETELQENLAEYLPTIEMPTDLDSLTQPEAATTPMPEQVAIPIEQLEPDASGDVTPTISAYLNSIDPYKRAAALAELARSRSKDAFSLIAKCFDDHSPHVRNAAARALRKLEPERTVDLFNRALEEGSAERRRNIGGAIAASGLATEAIDKLVSQSREDTYNALSILFVMAKTGEVQPLIRAIEEHRNDEIGSAVVKLLTLSGQADVAEAALKRRVNGTEK